MGYSSPAPSPYNMAEYMGFTPKYTDGTNVGGSSFVIYVEHALAAISAGLIDVALIVHGRSGAEYAGLRGGRPPTCLSPSTSTPYGLVIEPHAYSLACTRYMHEFRRGTHSQRTRRDSRVYP